MLYCVAQLSYIWSNCSYVRDYTQLSWVLEQLDQYKLYVHHAHLHMQPKQCYVWQYTLQNTAKYSARAINLWVEVMALIGQVHCWLLPSRWSTITNQTCGCVQSLCECVRSEHTDSKHTRTHTHTLLCNIMQHYLETIYALSCWKKTVDKMNYRDACESLSGVWGKRWPSKSCVTTTEGDSTLTEMEYP